MSALSRISAPGLLPGRTATWLKEPRVCAWTSGRDRNRAGSRLRKEDKCVSGRPPVHDLQANAARQHLQTRIEQRGMHPSAMLDSAIGGPGKRKSRLRAAALRRERLTFVRATVAERPENSGRIPSRRFSKMRKAPLTALRRGHQVSNRVQVMICSSTQRNQENPQWLPCASRPKRAKSRPAFLVATRSGLSLRWNCKSGKKRCRSMPEKRQQAAKCASPWREAFSASWKDTPIGSRRASRHPKSSAVAPRAPFRDRRQRENDRALNFVVAQVAMRPDSDLALELRRIGRAEFTRSPSKACTGLRYVSHAGRGERLFPASFSIKERVARQRNF